MILFWNYLISNSPARSIALFDGIYWLFVMLIDWKETIIVNFVQYLPVEFGNQTKEETKESCKYKMKLFMRKVNKIPL